MKLFSLSVFVLLSAACLPSASASASTYQNVTVDLLGTRWAYIKQHSTLGDAAKVCEEHFGFSNPDSKGMVGYFDSITQQEIVTKAWKVAAIPHTIESFLLGVVKEGEAYIIYSKKPATTEVGYQNWQSYYVGSTETNVIVSKDDSKWYQVPNTTADYNFFCRTSIEATKAPTASPTKAPTGTPTTAPTSAPTFSPTTNSPTHSPTASPTTDAPTRSPTTDSPTQSPTTDSPTKAPTDNTEAPTGVDSFDYRTVGIQFHAACRGGSLTDYNETYFVTTHANSLYNCTLQCDANDKCKGVEYQYSNSACRLWTVKKPSFTSVQEGFDCYTKFMVEETTYSRIGNVGISACRATNASIDQANFYYKTPEQPNIEECKMLCSKTSVCLGVEYNSEWHSCELWSVVPRETAYTNNSDCFIKDHTAVKSEAMQAMADAEAATNAAAAKGTSTGGSFAMGIASGTLLTMCVALVAVVVFKTKMSRRNDAADSADLEPLTKSASGYGAL